MRRSPTHIDHVDATTTTGASASRTDDFDAAYVELTQARGEYDRYHGDPTAIPSLAAAAKRLSDARATMSSIRAVNH